MITPLNFAAHIPPESLARSLRGSWANPVLRRCEHTGYFYWSYYPHAEATVRHQVGNFSCERAAELWMMWVRLQ